MLPDRTWRACGGGSESVRTIDGGGGGIRWCCGRGAGAAAGNVLGRFRSVMGAWTETEGSGLESRLAGWAPVAVSVELPLSAGRCPYVRANVLCSSRRLRRFESDRIACRFTKLYGLCVSGVVVHASGLHSLPTRAVRILPTCPHSACARLRRALLHVRSVREPAGPCRRPVLGVSPGSRTAAPIELVMAAAASTRTAVLVHPAAAVGSLLAVGLEKRSA